MSEELEKILESLPEEEKNSFIERVKAQAENAVKLAAERKEKEEEKKRFKASGHWEAEEKDGIKMSLDIDSEDRKQINFKIGENEFSLSKNDFFNFAKLLNDAYGSLSEEKDGENAVLSDDPWFDYISSIANNITNASLALNWPNRRRNKFFRIR